MNIKIFASDQYILQVLLEDIKTGEIQLPDFQRGWVWDDYHIRSLLASVSQAFPIGSVLTLETGGTGVSFKSRPIEEVDIKDDDKVPGTLILDGQQRLTALFQTLMSDKAVTTKNSQGRKTCRFYYLDMEACIRGGIEREEAILSTGVDQLQRSDGKIDLSSTEKQYANNMFPTHKIFESPKWMSAYQEYWKSNSRKEEFSRRFGTKVEDFSQRFDDEVIKCFRLYSVPVIRLAKETPREAICLIFEKVNTRGVTLTVFELLTATFAASDPEFRLREDWGERGKRLKKHLVLEKLESTSFLRALTLFSTNADPNSPVSCTRREILRLKVSDYNDWANRVEEGFNRAVRFLHSQKIFNARDLPYQTQLAPLAAILADLGDPAVGSEKIARWYWCGVFGEMYGAATDTRLANDFSEVTAWVEDDAGEPRTIQEANFHENRLLELRTRSSAAYKGVHALLMRKEGCRDFLTGVPIELPTCDDIDIHHIFPKTWCEEHKIGKDRYNSIINKTALSKRTNQKIGGKAPSQYLQDIKQDSMEEILASHRISADALRSDDFSAFFEERKEELLKAIEKVMGKPVIREGESSKTVFWNIDHVMGKRII